MQQHPGAHPGHPMGAPGMAHNPSQPGAQPGIPPQMAAHMAVSGPGGQVNPAAMMGGIPPGAAGPNAHALQHLNPQQQQQMFQQQQFSHSGSSKPPSDRPDAATAKNVTAEAGGYAATADGPRTKDDLTYWNNFVSQFFSPRGVYRISLFYVGSDTGNEEHTDKQYEITQPALARYFHTHYESGIKKINLTFEKGLTDRPLPNGCHFIENLKAHLTYWFEHSHVVASGVLRAQFDSEQKLDVLEFITQSHEEYHSRKMVTEAARPAHNWVKEWLKVNGQDSRSSPEMSKKGKAKTMKSPPNPPPDIDLPPSAVKQNIGLTEAVFQFLEVRVFL
ncbi:hypothetical protein PC116_g28554 [Phytophthora cactorum]|nr:hypothetical protein PC116_g28554 [Phytophthora cactorum]